MTLGIFSRALQTLTQTAGSLATATMSVAHFGLMQAGIQKPNISKKEKIDAKVELYQGLITDINIKSNEEKKLIIEFLSNFQDAMNKSEIGFDTKELPSILIPKDLEARKDFILFFQKKFQLLKIITYHETPLSLDPGNTTTLKNLIEDIENMLIK